MCPSVVKKTKINVSTSEYLTLEGGVDQSQWKRRAWWGHSSARLCHSNKWGGIVSEPTHTFHFLCPHSEGVESKQRNITNEGRIRHECVCVKYWWNDAPPPQPPSLSRCLQLLLVINCMKGKLRGIASVEVSCKYCRFFSQDADLYYL